jgi:hypothetical protein
MDNHVNEFDMVTTRNWTVFVYNEDQEVIDEWIIKDRTQHDAHREAESEVEHRHPNADSWTMYPEKEPK